MKARRGEERMLAVITLAASLLAAAAAAAPAEVLRSTDGRVLAAARSRGPDVGFDERRARHCMAHSECQSDEFCESVYFMCSSCSRCGWHGDAIDTRCPASCGPQQARPDRDAPILRSIAIAPAQVDVRRSVVLDEKIIVTIRIQVADDGSRFKMSKMRLRSVSQSQSIEIGVYAPPSTQASAGQAFDWQTIEYEGKFWFQRGDESGIWSVTDVVLRDHAANHRAYTQQALHALGLQHNASVTVTSDLRVQCPSADGAHGHARAAWANCIESGGACEAAPAAAGGWGGSLPTSQCACANSTKNLTSNKLQCLPDTQYDFRHPSFWTAAALQASTRDPQQAVPPTSPSHMGTFWTTDVGEPAFLGGKASAGEQRQEPAGVDEARQVDEVREQKTTSVSLQQRFVFSLSFLMMPCVFILLCLHVCRRYSQMREMRRRRRMLTAEEAAILDSLEESARGGLVATPMNSLFWRHARERARQRQASDRREMELAEQGLQAIVQNGRIVAVVALNRHDDQQLPAHDRLRGMGIDPLGGLQDEAYAMQPGSLPWELWVQAPAARDSLPEHVRKAALPGEVQEEVPEGSECAVCMICEKNTRLHPCGHQDLCRGCAEHIHATLAMCPVCRAPIASVEML